MASSDYYAILGVSRSASDEEIRKAYKKLSGKYHPDRNPDDKQALETYKKVQEAYSVLKDQDKRRKYDQFGENWNRVPEGGGVPPWAGGGGGAGPIDLEQLFGAGGIDLEDLLGGGRSRGGHGQRAPRSTRGQDQSFEIEVPFYIACEGGTREVRVTRDGKPETIDVTIPPGVNTGNQIRLAGLGHAGQYGGGAGDLLLKIRVSPHPFFIRDGNDLTIEVPISPAEAVLGTKIDVPTLDEKSVTVTVPPKTDSGKRLRVRSRGVPDRKTGSRGDLFVRIKIVLPSSISDEEVEIYGRLRAMESPVTRPS